MNDPLTEALRLFTILHLLASRRQGRKITSRHLMDACTCCAKTIQRDMQSLRSHHIPIEWDSRECSYVLSEKGWTLPALLLTQTDALALAMVRGLMASNPQFPFAEKVGVALDKATAGLSPELSRLAEAGLAAWNESGGLARDYSQAPLQILMMAAAKKRTVEMVYESRRSGISLREVDPYRFDRRDGRYLEMQAWCHKNGEVLTFALNRVQEAHITEKTFVLREWESSDEGVVGGLRGGALIAVEACFDPVVAQLARERRWPFKVSFEDKADGSTILRGKVQGVDGIIRELLSWRHHVQVLGGPELRAAMIADVRSLAALYVE